MCFKGVSKISVPKDRVIALIEKMDGDQDGYISIAEIEAVLRTYGKAVKRSMRFARRSEPKV